MTALFIGGLIIGRSSADLFVHESAAKHGREWASAWSKVPTSFRGAKVIVFETKGAIPGEDDDTLGLWTPSAETPAKDGNTIQLSADAVKGTPEASAQFIRLHELGHQIQDQFTKEEEAAWEHAWEGHLQDLPTDYAHANPYEGFAECFATFITSPKRLNRAVKAATRTALRL